jgi:hypothetical protein
MFVRTFEAPKPPLPQYGASVVVLLQLQSKGCLIFVAGLPTRLGLGLSRSPFFFPEVGPYKGNWHIQAKTERHNPENTSQIRTQSGTSIPHFAAVNVKLCE